MLTRQQQAALEILGWDETHLDAYRDGYTDALLWALEHEPEEIVEVLEKSDKRPEGDNDG